MRIALYESARDASPRVQDLDWPSIVAMLTSHRRTPCNGECAGKRCPEKNGPAWSPVEIYGSRLNSNVRAVTVGVFDLDHLSEDRASAVVQTVTTSGIACVAHSSHSHRRPSDWCLRLAFALSRPVTPREWPVVRAAIVRRFTLPADPATKDLSRLYFLPSAPAGAEVYAAAQEGVPLDVDELFAAGRAGAATLIAPRVELPSDAALALPAEMLPVGTDLFELRAKLRRVQKPESRELVRRVLAGEAVAQPGERDTTLQRLSSLLAFVLPTETPFERVLEVVRPSLRATSWEGEAQPIEAVFAEKYQRAHADRQQRDAEQKALVDQVTAMFGRPLPAAAQAAPLEPGDPNPQQWQTQIRTVEVKGETRFQNCEANFELVLAHSPEWAGVIRLNNVTRQIEIEGGPLRPNVALECLHVEIAIWIQRSIYGQLGLNPRPHQLFDIISGIAQRNAFDPLREYLLALQWDGESRAEDLFLRYFNAESVDSTGQDISRYLRAVGVKFLIGAVARALQPGCKLDTLPVIEGKQGIRKSSAFRVLGGEWFTDARIDVSNKDSAMLASRYWILELAEMDAARRAEAEALKAFLSKDTDSFRPPYGRTTVQAPRRCVFVGTTNSPEYLKDPTGGRRFWPVRATSVDISALEADRDQLWAEAVHRYHTGEVWWLSGDEEILPAVEQASARSSVPAYAEEIATWLLQQSPASRPRTLTAAEFGFRVLGFSSGDMDQRRRSSIGTALYWLGFERQISKVGGTRSVSYRTPEALLSAEQAGPGAHPRSILQVLAEAKVKGEVESA